MQCHFSLRGHRTWGVWLTAGLGLVAALLWADSAAAASRPAAAPPPAAPPKAVEDPVPDASSPWAEVTFAAPQRFAIVSELQTKRKRLYGKGDLIPEDKGPEQRLVVDNVDDAGLQIRDTRTQKLIRVAVGQLLPGDVSRRLTEIALLNGVDYCYVTAKGAVDSEPRVFQIRMRRAAMVVDTPATRAAVAAAPADSTPRPQSRAYALQTQQRLDGTILGKVRVEGVARDTYDVSSADLRMAMNHSEQVLMEAWSTVRPIISLDQGITFQIKSPVADGVLGPRGFKVTSPNLAERAGLEMGDVVVAINQQPINGFGDVFRLYRQVKADQNLSTVEVKLERQGQLVTKTYRIR
jgi:hypothetical protein